MELESTHLIIKNLKPGTEIKIFSYEKDMKQLTNLLHSVLSIINIFIIMVAFIFFFVESDKRIYKFSFFQF